MNQPSTAPLKRKGGCAGNFTALGTAVLPLFEVGPEIRLLAPPAPLLTGARWLRLPVAGPTYDAGDEAEHLPSPHKVK